MVSIAETAAVRVRAGFNDEACFDDDAGFNDVDRDSDVEIEGAGS